MEPAHEFSFCKILYVCVYVKQVFSCVNADYLNVTLNNVDGGLDSIRSNYVFDQLEDLISPCW